MADNPAAVQQAVQRALSEALGSIQRQLGEVQSSVERLQGLLAAAGEQETGDRFATVLPALVRMQASGAALAATIDTAVRFMGVSAQWTAAPMMAAVAHVPAPTYAEAPAPPPAEVSAPAPAAVAPPPPPPAPVVEVAPPPPPVVEAPPVVAAAPAAPAAPALDIEALPDELKQLHQKARRFAKVAVQEFIMYKKDEVTKGRENKDLYSRFRDEIDKSKAQYDKRFEKIAAHNIDYLYDELVRVLADNDSTALGNYPYTPSNRS